MNQSEKNAIVTGATGAIGAAIARQMAQKGFSVTLIVRDETKARNLISEIIRTTGNEHIDFVVADISRKIEIQKIAEVWNKPLHVLINNAAATPRSREETPEGIEMQFATNVLGYYWMIQHFLPFLKTGAPARIVNVASYWAGDLDLDDLECKKRSYNNDAIYRQTKQADRMLSVAFAERMKNDDITVNSVHPGDVNSKLSNNLGYGGHETPDEGADTPVWVATTPELSGITGKYFERRNHVRCGFGEDKSTVERLFEICSQY